MGSELSRAFDALPGLMWTATPDKRAEALLAGEKRLLEMVALGLPLHTVLDALCHVAEEVDSGCQSAILLLDRVNKAFLRGGASSRTSRYVDGVHGICRTLPDGGTAPAVLAATSLSSVIVEDVASDPRCAPIWRAFILSHGLRACCSTPILSRTNEVLGTFAIYRADPGTPTPFQRELIGRLTHIASIAIERAHSDMALKRSMAGFDSIVEMAPDCVTLIAPDGTLLQINAAGAAKIGASADVLVGRSFFDFVAPEHRQRYVEFGREVFAGKKGLLEFDLITLAGERRHMETNVAPMQRIDGTVAALGMSRDITPRRQAEADLRRREALMVKAQQLSGSGSFCWHVESGEIKWSEPLYRIFGIELGTQVTLELIAAHHHADDLHLVQDMIARVQAGLEFKYEHRLRMGDGSIKYLYTEAHPTRDEQGQLEYIGAAQDVTARRRSEEALGELRAELAHVTRVNSLGTLTASIAHEINQPLAGIMTNASTGLRMLGADPPNVDGALETLRRTLRDGRRASEVVTRLRALFSKKAAMADAMRLDEAADDVVELLRSEIRRQRVVLRLERGNDLPPVTGDRVQLQQVVLNLLLNAMEAMQAVEDRPRQLLIRTEREGGDRVRLAVRDSGSGFDPQQSGKLFDAFYTTKREGMGIGLSVSRSIIESHGGRLWAEPNEGPGATFAFSIPCRSSVAAAAGGTR